MMPIWSRNGREVFYQSPRNQIMVSDYIVRGDSFVASKPRVWSTRSCCRRVSPTSIWPRRERFAIAPDPGAPPAEVRVTVLLNFFDELRRRLP